MAPTSKSTERSEPVRHALQLYGTDTRLLAKSAGQFLQDGLSRGDGVLVIASRPQTYLFARQLSGGPVYQQAVKEERLVFADADILLDRFMVDGEPHWDRFESVLGDIIQRLRARTDHAGLRAYGEMVGLLWTSGQCAAAVRLEEYWNRLLDANQFRLFCAYPIDLFDDDVNAAVLAPILCAHTHLLPADQQLDDAVGRAMNEVLGPRSEEMRLLARGAEPHRTTVVPDGAAVILWLKAHRPEFADAILSRARGYYRQMQ